MKTVLFENCPLHTNFYYGLFCDRKICLYENKKYWNYLRRHFSIVNITAGLSKELICIFKLFIWKYWLGGQTPAIFMFYNEVSKHQTLFNPKQEPKLMWKQILNCFWLSSCLQSRKGGSTKEFAMETPRSFYCSHTNKSCYHEVITLSRNLCSLPHSQCHLISLELLGSDDGVNERGGVWVGVN